MEPKVDAHKLIKLTNFFYGLQVYLSLNVCLKIRLKMIKYTIFFPPSRPAQGRYIHVTFSCSQKSFIFQEINLVHVYLHLATILNFLFSVWTLTFLMNEEKVDLLSRSKRYFTFHQKRITEIGSVSLNIFTMFFRTGFAFINHNSTDDLSLWKCCTKGEWK